MTRPCRFSVSKKLWLTAPIAPPPPPVSRCTRSPASQRPSSAHRVSSAAAPDPMTPTIGNDVWLGHHAIILPGASKIGDGAVIGAGAVVNRDVPPYAVIVGNPGRVVKFRFPEETRKELQESRWWEQSFERILPHFDDFQEPLD